MGESVSRKYGFVQDLLLIVVSVSCVLCWSCLSLLVLRLLADICLQSFSMYYIAKSIVASLPLGTDPDKEQHEQARVKAAANLRRLDKLRGGDNTEDEYGRGTDGSRRTRKEDLELDQYESQIAMEVVAPEDISVGFDGK
jgi:hypothetical protein